MLPVNAANQPIAYPASNAAEASSSKKMLDDPAKYDYGYSSPPVCPNVWEDEANPSVPNATS